MYVFICVYERRLLLICIFILKLLFISTSPLRSHCALPCRWVAVLSTSPAMANPAACASKIVGQVCRWFGALKEFLSAEGISLQFVFVSACYSKAIGEAFVKAGVPHVVCVKVDSQVEYNVYERNTIWIVWSMFMYGCLCCIVDPRWRCDCFHQSILCRVLFRKICHGLLQHRKGGSEELALRS